MSGSISFLPPSQNQLEIQALAQEGVPLIQKGIDYFNRLLPVLQKFSDTVGDGRAQAQALAKSVTLDNNKLSLAESLKGYKDAVLGDASFDSSLGRTAIFKNGNNPVLLKNIKEWQSRVADYGQFPREKELAFGAAMQSLEEAFRTSDQSGQQEILKLTKYIVNRSPVPKNKFKIYGDYNSEEARLLRYAQDVRAVLSPAMSFTAQAVSLKSPNLDQIQGLAVRQSTEQALKQLMSMCSASSSEKPMSSDNFGYAVEELKKTIFPDQISDYDGKLYEQKVINHLREWGKANQAVNSCDRQKEPYLKLRLELLTGMVLQEILQSTDNNMEPFKDKKELLQIINFMMQQPVTTSEEKKWLLPMFAQPGRNSWNLFNRNTQMPDDTQPDKRLVSYFNDQRPGYYPLSTLQVSVAIDYLNKTRIASNEYAGIVQKRKDFTATLNKLCEKGPLLPQVLNTSNPNPDQKALIKNFVEVLNVILNNTLKYNNDNEALEKANELLDLTKPINSLIRFLATTPITITNANQESIRVDSDNILGEDTAGRPYLKYPEVKEELLRRSQNLLK